MSVPFHYQVPSEHVKQHQQDKLDFCGAAATQMLLRSENEGLILQFPDLRSDIKSVAAFDPGVGWEGAPDGVFQTVRKYAGDGRFYLFRDRDVDVASKRIVQSLYATHVAALALVYGGRHWVVIYGFTTSEAPVDNNGKPTDFQICSFDLYDPWPPLPGHELARGYEHTDSDDCGKGVIPGKGDMGHSLNNVSYEWWKGVARSGKRHLVPGTFDLIRNGSRSWQGVYISICKQQNKPSRQEYSPTSDASEQEEPPLTPPGTFKEEDKQEIKDLDFEDMLEKAGLRGRDRGGNPIRPDWDAIVNGEIVARDPIPVQRIDVPDHNYWLVPLGIGDVNTPLVVLLDEKEKKYLQASGVPGKNGNVIDIPDLEEAMRRIEGTSSLGAGQAIQWAHGSASHPYHVWQPSRESLSPLYPFARFDLDHRTGNKHLHIRSDLKPFRKLTRNRFGL